MKKVITLLFILLLIYIAARFTFSYTIFNVPDSFGRVTFVGGSKYDFPICVVNSIKTNPIKNIILQYVKQKFADEPQISSEELKAIKYAVNYQLKYDREKYYEICYYENLRSFFGEQDMLKDFDIASVAISIEEVARNKNVNSFLLQQKENPEKKCVAIFDRKSNKLLRFGF